MIKRSAWGNVLAVTVLSSGLVIGCNPKSSVVANPDAKIDEGRSLTETTKGSGESTEGGVPGGTTPTDATATPTTAGGTGTTTPGEAPGTTPPVADNQGDQPVTPAGTASGSTPLTLRFAFAKGSEMKYLSTSESTTTMSGGNAKMPAMKPVSTSANTVVKVVDVTGGNAKVELSVANMDIKGGMTDPNAQKQMQKMTKDMVGMKVIATFDAMGNPSNQKYEKGDKMQAMAVGVDSSTGFLGLTYPEKALNLGDTWSHSVDYKSVFGAMGQMASAKWTSSNVTTKFTLKSIDTTKGTAVIGIAASGNPSFSMKLGEIAKGAEKDAKMPAEMKMSFKISGSGTATVDLKTGLPTEINYEISTEFSNPMAGGSMVKKDKAMLKRQ